MLSTEKRRFKDEVYGQFARIGKALASRRRLELLDLLAQTPRSVEDLAEQAGMSVANASQHLQVLKRARLVDAHQSGTHVFYSLADENVFALWQSLREVARARLADVDRITRDYLQNREALEPVPMSELLERMKNEEVVVLDVRPAEEYDSGHIAGARSVPLDELEALLADLPQGTELVVYCRGPYCVFADEAVERLTRHGHPARRLELGFPDWKAAGLPVENHPG